MAASGTFSGNTSSSWVGPVRGKITVACDIPDGGIDFEWRVVGTTTAYVGYSFDNTTEFPRTLEVNSEALEYRLTRTSHSSAAFYYIGQKMP